MKRIIAMLLSSAMLLSLMCVGVFAANSDDESVRANPSQIVNDGGKVYYLANGEEASADNFDVWTSKTIKETGTENEFEITLQIGSTTKAVSNNAAVVLVMDVSGSMMCDETGNRWYDNNMPEGRKRRIEYTREATMAFAEAFVKNAGSANRMLSIVQFGNQAQTVLPWTDVNAGGKLDDAAKDAIDSVQVNFSVAENVSYWDESIAMNRWAKVNYWDDSEVSAEMKDEFKDFLTSKCQTAELKDFFQSYLKTETVSQEIEGTTVDVDVTSCTYPECLLTAEHNHCSYDGCTQTEANHKHCTVKGCAVAEEHVHCSECDLTTEHKHCDYADCEVAEAHTHCGHENCMIAEQHKHCVRCGDTSEHTHSVGCTLGGCLTPYEGPHTHCCTHSRDCIIPYSMKYRWSSDYNYRCKNPDPAHTHDFWDSDTAYVCFSRYFGSVWAIGTNMEAGLLLARNLVTTGLEDGGAIDGIDDVYVILLSDGNPTWRTDETSTSETQAVGKADNTGTWDALKDIVKDGGENDIAIAEDIKSVAGLYAILYSNDLEGKFNAGQGHPLTGVSGADWLSKSGDYYVGADAVFNSPAADGLDTAFLQINDRIEILSKAWTVTDELSDEIVFNEFNLNSEYALYNDDTHAITWNVGNMEPENPDAAGTVKDPFVYTLKYTVTLNPDYEGVYDASLSGAGINTNKQATLSYIMTDGKEDLKKLSYDELLSRAKKADFEHPAVKAFYADFAFTKLSSLDNTALAGAGFTLYKDGEAWSNEVFSDENGAVKFERLSAGTYELRETTVPEGMQEMDSITLEVSYGVLTADGSVMPEYIYNEPIDNKVNVVISGKKFLDGQPAAGFLFRMEDAAGRIIRSAVSVKSGNFRFADIEFTKEGTYTYTVYQVASDDENIVYDDNVYTVTVTVTQKNYKLQARVDVKSIKFYSTTVEKPTEPSEDPTEPIEPTEPTEPSVDPTDPTEPTNPSEAPTEPSETPTEPTEDPTEPSETPTEPSEDPTQPSEDSTDPTEESTDPSENPTDPSEDAGAPDEESPDESAPQAPSDPDENPKTGDADVFMSVIIGVMAFTAMAVLVLNKKWHVVG